VADEVLILGELVHHLPCVFSSYTHPLKPLESVAVFLALLCPVTQLPAREIPPLTARLQSFVIQAALQYPAVRGSMVGSVPLAPVAAKILRLDLYVQLLLEPIDDLLG